jgi:hypothetical protein
MAAPDRRRPSVAGVFYPSDPGALRRKLASLMEGGTPRPAKAVLVPHAGYDYSGRVAGAVYSRVAVTRDVVLVAFHHRGRGARFGIWSAGAWETPLGPAPVAEELAARLKAACPDLQEDAEGFLGEHSAEVQVPFLQAARPDVRIAPLSVNAWEGGTEGRPELAEFGRALAAAVREELVVATTDLSHCGAGYDVLPPAGLTPREHAADLDARILGRLKSLDVDGFWETLARLRVPMCGVGPTAVFLEYGRARGAGSAEVVSYATSADLEPDADRAVGYPGVVIW